MPPSKAQRWFLGQDKAPCCDIKECFNESYILPYTYTVENMDSVDMDFVQRNNVPADIHCIFSENRQIADFVLH